MKFVIIAVSMVLVAGILHMVFIGYDYAFHNQDSGLLPNLRGKLNETMTAEYRNNAYNQSQMYREAFGWSRVILIVLAPVVGCIELIKRPRMEQ